MNHISRLTNGCCGRALLALVTGCRQSDSFFPLSSGSVWRYRTKLTTGAGETLGEQTISVDSTDKVADKAVTIRRSSSGHLWAINESEQGIARIAARREIDDEWQSDPEPYFVLKTPHKVGTTWQAKTAPYMLTRRAEFPPELVHNHSTVMTYSIVALNEAVSVPAGEFSDCIEVEGTAAQRLYVDPVAGFADVPLTTLEWYCKGMGLVKLTRVEKVNSPFLSGGEFSMELVASSRN